MAGDIQIYLNNFFSRHALANCRIGVALSGGRDSVALAYALKLEGYDIVAINIEHGIRGESSLKDSAFVADFCREQGIELYSYSVNAPDYCAQKGLTLEQGARELRYQCFEAALNSGACDVLALAHHLDDQAETVLMRIIRGTGISGLKGMSEVRGRYIRPLLDCPREEIEAYITNNKLRYVDDESNYDTDFTRNFIRAELKRIKERFPGAIKSLARLSQNASEADAFIEQLIPPVSVEGKEARLRICDMQTPYIAKRLIYKAICALGVSQDIESRHFALILALKDGENGKRIELTHGICAHKEYDYIVFVKANALEPDGELPFAIGDFGNFAIEYSSVDELRSGNKTPTVLFADAAAIPSCAVIRHRREGDFIKKFGGGTKSLGDFLTDKKLPLRKRDELWLIANGSEVLAVIGVDISSLLAVGEQSESVLKISLK